MTAATLRRRHLVRHLHALGERAVDELLIELGRAHGIADDILTRLEGYGRLDRNTVAALGADRMPPVPLHVVEDAA